MTDKPAALVLGGAGFVGSALCRRLREQEHSVVAVDRREPAAPDAWLRYDALTDEPADLPAGELFLVLGASDPRPRRPWTLVLENALATARLLPAMKDRRVTLASSVEVYGSAAAPLREESTPTLPLSTEELENWCLTAERLSTSPCPPWRAERTARELADADPSGRWVYALSKSAQEMLVRKAVAPDRLRVLRPANLFGVGQDRVVSRLVRRVLNGRTVTVTDCLRTFSPVEELVDALLLEETGTFNVGSSVVSLVELAKEIVELVGHDVPIEVLPAPDNDTCGVVDSSLLASRGFRARSFDAALKELVNQLRFEHVPIFEPPLPVVIPPRPEQPSLLADRQLGCQWSGRVKHGNYWTGRLTDELTERLRLPPDKRLIVTNTGTSALRLLLWSTVGPAKPRQAVALPAYTFPATAEVALQLGYNLRFCDVDADFWTMTAESLHEALDERVQAVISVDTFGNPVHYNELLGVCRAAAIPLLADSAPSLGSWYQGVPVGGQADGHAFSMSFAKALTAGGSGGAVVVPAAASLSGPENLLRSSLMPEINAAAALDLLPVLDDLVSRRQEIADTYQEMCGRYPDVQHQRIRSDARSSWVHWVMCLGPRYGRESVVAGLRRLGVETKPYYWPALHEAEWQHGWEPGSASREALPVSSRLHRSALALPMSSEMTLSDAERVSSAVDSVFAEFH